MATRPIVGILYKGQPVTEFKVSNGVIAEFTAKLPNGDKFIIADVTIKFCASLGEAQSAAVKVKQELNAGTRSEQADMVRGMCTLLQDTVANGCRIDYDLSATFVRIQQKARPVW